MSAEYFRPRRSDFGINTRCSSQWKQLPRKWTGSDIDTAYRSNLSACQVCSFTILTKDDKIPEKLTERSRLSILSSQGRAISTQFFIPSHPHHFSFNFRYDNYDRRVPDVSAPGVTLSRNVLVYPFPEGSTVLPGMILPLGLQGHIVDNRPWDDIFYNMVAFSCKDRNVWHCENMTRKGFLYSRNGCWSSQRFLDCIE